MADGVGTSYGYDPIDRLTESSRDGRSVSHAYDPAGRLNAFEYPGAHGSVVLSYDTAVRLVTIADWDEPRLWLRCSRSRDVHHPSGRTCFRPSGKTTPAV